MNDIEPVASGTKEEIQRSVCSINTCHGSSNQENKKHTTFTIFNTGIFLKYSINYTTLCALLWV